MTCIKLASVLGGLERDVVVNVTVVLGTSGMSTIMEHVILVAESIMFLSLQRIVQLMVKILLLTQLKWCSDETLQWLEQYSVLLRLLFRTIH